MSPAITPVSSFAMLFLNCRPVDHRAVPWVTFTDPELANVGLTEVQAKDLWVMISES